MGKAGDGNLRIVIFAYWHDKGWQRFVGATVKVWDFAQNSSTLGHSTTLVLPNYHFSRDFLPFCLVEIPLLDLPLLRALSFNIALTLFLIIHSLSLKPDVVYIRRGVSALPAIFARLKKAILIYEINDDPYPAQTSAPANALSRLNRWISRKTDEVSLSLCHGAFVITEEVRNKIIGRMPNLDVQKLWVLPSGANTDLYRPLDKVDCRMKLHLDPSKRYIGFMGTLLDHQGIDVLIDAAPSVLRRIPEALFVVIGEGPMKEPWQRRVEEMSLQDRFFFPGQIDYCQTPLWINAMDICTAPFLVKAGLRSPVKIFDYLACGKPVVASRIPGTTDLFSDSGAVSLIEPENCDALAGALTTLLKDRHTAEEMGRLGRALVETHYSRQILAKKVLDTVKSLRNRIQR